MVEKDERKKEQIQNLEIQVQLPSSQPWFGAGQEALYPREQGSCEGHTLECGDGQLYSINMFNYFVSVKNKTTQLFTCLSV